MKVIVRSIELEATQYNAVGDHPKVKVLQDGQIGCLKPEGYFPIIPGDYIVEAAGQVVDIVSPERFEEKYVITAPDPEKTEDEPEEVSEEVTEEESETSED